MRRIPILTFLAGLLIGAASVLLAPQASLPEPDATVRAVPDLGRESGPAPQISGTSPRAAPDPEAAASDRSREGARDAVAPERMPTAPLDRTCVVRARIVAVGGGVAARSTLFVRAQFGEHVCSGYATTDGDGVLTFTVRGVLPPDTPGILECEPGRPTGGLTLYVPPGVRGSVPLPHPLPVGGVDVGELRLQPTPVVGSGVVVDSRGGPLAGASVEFAVTGEGTGPTLYRVRTDAQGRFELRHSGVVRAAAITVTHRGFLEERLPAVRVGDDALRVTLTPAGSVQGRIRCAAGVRPKIWLQSSDGKVHKDATIWSGASGDTHRFAFRDVPAGQAVLQYGLSGGSLRSISIEVSEGDAAKPLELAIDAP